MNRSPLDFNFAEPTATEARWKRATGLLGILCIVDLTWIWLDWQSLAVGRRQLDVAPPVPPAPSAPGAKTYGSGTARFASQGSTYPTFRPLGELESCATGTLRVQRMELHRRPSASEAGRVADVVVDYKKETELLTLATCLQRQSDRGRWEVIMVRREAAESDPSGGAVPEVRFVARLARFDSLVPR